MLMHIFETYLVSKRESLVREGVKLESIGDISRFPDRVKRALQETKEATKTRGAYCSSACIELWQP